MDRTDGRRKQADEPGGWSRPVDGLPAILYHQSAAQPPARSIALENRMSRRGTAVCFVAIAAFLQVGKHIGNSIFSSGRGWSEAGEELSVAALISFSVGVVYLAIAEIARFKARKKNTNDIQ